MHGTPCRSYIEIGVSDGTRCTTRQLRERGWAGLLLGSGPVNTSINLHTAAPTGDTIVRFLMQHSAPREPDLLAIYATLHTFWVLHAALQSGCRPRVIAAEINRNFHPADAFVAPHAPHSHWDGSTVFGASAGAFDVLFEQFGYATLAINQAQGTVFAVHKDAVGDERLMTMAKITAGVTATPLCQAAHTCNGDSRWLEVTKKAAVMMRLPRADWYNTLPAWTVRCERVTRPLGADQVQWGTPGPAEWLPTFEPGVVALLPCLPLADVAAVGAAMVAAQSGPPNNGTAEPPAASDGTNGTVCASCNAATRRGCCMPWPWTGQTVAMHAGVRAAARGGGVGRAQAEVPSGCLCRGQQLVRDAPVQPVLRRRHHRHHLRLYPHSRQVRPPPCCRPAFVLICHSRRM